MIKKMSEFGKQTQEYKISAFVNGIVFPKEAWRGIFETYKQAQEGTTEAPDQYHFAVFKPLIPFRRNFS